MFTKETCLLDRGCCDRKINCIHKAMAMWFLKQTEQLSRPWRSQTMKVNQTEKRELMTKTCELSFYPPMDEELLLRMIKYLHNFKKYDADILGDFNVLQKSKIPSNIITEENVCINCQTPLSNPVKVCGNMRVFTMQIMGFFSIEVFYHDHSRIKGLQGKGEGISLNPHYHFHPLHWHLDISRAIATDTSPLHIGCSRTWTGNLWFLSTSR